VTVRFTVEGELRGAKRALPPTPLRVEVRVPSDMGADSTVTIPVPHDVAIDLNRLIRDVMPERVLTLGHGGYVTITVTIDGTP
jgi:hypothetical protein